ncbi:IS4 family transposase [Streptomyces sp. A1-5]|nr:IS4 family transposase [Streptomyces sp. A1-5]
MDAVLEEAGAVQRRVRMLPSRVVTYFVLALALFETCSYRVVWGKMAAGLSSLDLARPSASALCRARRRVGTEPFRLLFEILCGSLGRPDTPGCWWRGLRLVAIDGTHLHIPDSQHTAARFPKRIGKSRSAFGYPLLRLCTLVECGTRALLGAAFGPEDQPETAYASRLLDKLTGRMLVLLDAGFDSADFLLELQDTGAQFLCRSGASRNPLIHRRLPDGSYLSMFRQHKKPVRSRGRFCQSDMPSITASVMWEIVCLETSAPYTSARRAAISPCVSPFADRDRTISSTPVRHRWRFLTICGSNEPSRSRGTSISTGPTSVRTVLDRLPFRELPPFLPAGSCLS